MGMNWRGLASSTRWNSQASEEGSCMKNCLLPVDLGQADSQIMQVSSWSRAKLLEELLLLEYSSGEDPGDNTDDT